jgi:hypothetical protein
MLHRLVCAQIQGGVDLLEPAMGIAKSFDQDRARWRASGGREYVNCLRPG